MLRRSFLKLFGLGPAAVATAPAASAMEKFAEASKKLNLPPAPVPLYTSKAPAADGYDCATCVSVMAPSYTSCAVFLDRWKK